MIARNNMNEKRAFSDATSSDVEGTIIIALSATKVVVYTTMRIKRQYIQKISLSVAYHKKVTSRKRYNPVVFQK